MIEKTKKGYKLFECKDGKLYPLFIGKDKETKIGEWIPAEFIPTKGFSTRPGWHIGDMPDAPWLKSYNGTDKGYYKSRFSNGQRVWCEVEWNCTNDYSEYVQTLPKKQMSNEIPKNGYYLFREAGRGVWSITSDIKVIRVIDERERQEILKAMGYDEAKAFEKYNRTLKKRMETISKK